MAISLSSVLHRFKTRGCSVILRHGDPIGTSTQVTLRLDLLDDTGSP